MGRENATLNECFYLPERLHLSIALLCLALRCARSFALDPKVLIILLFYPSICDPNLNFILSQWFRCENISLFMRRDSRWNTSRIDDGSGQSYKNAFSGSPLNSAGSMATFCLSTFISAYVTLRQYSGAIVNHPSIDSTSR